MDKLMIEQLKRCPARLEDYYNFLHDKRGIAVIFNQEVFIDPDYPKRKGSRKDGDDLKDVLEKLNFDVELHMDLELDEIKKILRKVSEKDHSNNDCLWVTVMSHGGGNGEIIAKDKEYNVQELWENFIGDNCKSLVGKPKMFFIQACRGSMIDTLVSFQLNEQEEVDSSKNVHEIPQLADLLVMYSTAEDHLSFRSPKEGSWFIQALCEELKTNLLQIDRRNDFMQILTRVNRKVAFDKKSYYKFILGKQMPSIVSMLTKSIFFFEKSLTPVDVVSSDPLSNVDSVLSVDKSKKEFSLRCPARLEDYYNFLHDKRGIAVIFNHEVFIDPDYPKRKGSRKDGDDLKDVLEKLNFDVELHMDLELDEIKKILRKVSEKDHSNNDCLWVTVMSHGGRNGKIFAKDKEYNVQELWENFIGDNCKSLVGKPKMFFIHVCRGEEDSCIRNNHGVVSILEVETDGVDPVSIKKTIPNFADLLVVYSTYDGHVSYRNTFKGSWFIQALCKELNVGTHDCFYDELMNILSRVNRKVALDFTSESNSQLKVAKQIPFIESTLRKSIIFFNKSSVDSVSSVEKPKNLRYHISNDNRGIALIFNHENDSENNSGVQKNADELKVVLEKLHFKVRYHKVITLNEIKEILEEVSRENHSNNDCLLVSVMTSFIKDGEKGHVNELCENFAGENCKTLIGKPKLFFIEASRGKAKDYSVELGNQYIPNSADCLVMYSTTEGHSSFHSETDGSWFIQALCKEFKTNLEDDLLTILTRVNKRVAFAAQSNTSNKAEFKVGTQIANIESTLTKPLYFKPSKTKSDLNYNFSNAKRGIALIFNHVSFEDKPTRGVGAYKDDNTLLSVLEALKFDVRFYMNLKLKEIKEILKKVSRENHSNNDCLLVIVMSHGTVNGEISAADEDYQVKKLWKNFVGGNCDSLIGKPKLFFIEAARGDSVENVTPKLADFLIMYSTVEDHCSFRGRTYGSWFINALCKELDTDSNDNLLSILTRANRSVAFVEHPKNKYHKQMPIIVSMLRKQLYLTQ